MSFKDEYKKFLKNYGVDFDERYVWDSSVRLAPALGLPDGLICYHRALHDVTNRRSFGAE